MTKLEKIYSEDPTVITSNKAFDLNAYKDEVVFLIKRSFELDNIVEAHEKEKKALFEHLEMNTDKFLKKAMYATQRLDEAIENTKRK